MRTLRILLVVLPLAALGCRTNPNQVLLEQESRLLEDKVWELQAMLDDAHAARETVIRENQELKKQLDGRDDGVPNDYAPRSDRSDLRPPAVELPSNGSAPPSRSRRGSAPALTPPTVEMPDTPTDAPTDAPAVELPTGEDHSALGTGRPTELVINERFTHGLDRDAEGGDDGLQLLVEPRNANGQVVRPLGDLSVVVMDPALEGEATRIARWDFPAEEVNRHFQNRAGARGVRLDLPWLKGQPKNRDLQVFVRMTTPDGMKVVADGPLSIRLAGDPPRADVAQLAAAREQAPAAAVPASRLTSREPRRPAPKRWQPDRSHTAPDETARGGDDQDAPRESGDRDSEPRDSEPRDRDRRDGESPRQASRMDRPVWKPYR